LHEAARKMTTQERKPRAIRMDAIEPAIKPAEKTAEKERKPRASASVARLEPVPDEAAQAHSGDLAALEPPPPPAKRGFGWGTLLAATLGGLVSLATGLAIDRLIRDLFERTTWLGWLAAALAALAVLAAAVLALREILALSCQRAIGRLREDAAEAIAANDTRKARRVLKQLLAMQTSVPETAKGRERLAATTGEVIDGADLLKLAERELLAPLDGRAAAIVMDSARRVSVVTAVSPRALVDIAFVLMENLRLIRRIAQLYGGRPGFIGSMRLARDVISHLAATGAIALGEGMLQQLIGHGLAARLSARLGEGVINGLLTARIGISAMDVCRPMPFVAGKRPGLSQYLTELMRFGGTAQAPAQEQTDDHRRSAQRNAM
jgi:putative membrane protein